MSHRIWLWLALIGVVGAFSIAGIGQAAAATRTSGTGIGAAAAVTPNTAIAGAAIAAGASAVPPVTDLKTTSVTPTTVTVSWQWPSAATVTSVTVRVAAGGTAPTSPAKGTSGGTAKRPARTLKIAHLAAHTKYAFAVFARNKAGQYARAATVDVITAPLPLKLATTALPQGIEGLFYIDQLDATGGIAPYTWKATGLPRGLSLSAAGVLDGYPRATGTRTITIKATDARKTTVTRKLRLAVPTSLPAACVAKSCAQLSRNTYTVQVPAKDLVTVTRSTSTGEVTSVALSGITVVAGDILVLPPASAIPSGLIAVANSVRPGSAKGQLAVAVTRATPADAFYQGIVQTIAAAPTAGVSAGTGQGPRSPRSARPRADADLTCDGGVTAEVHGLTVEPALKAHVALDWKHNLFGRKGVYAGYGGLKLFQFGLDGTVTVDLGASVSGAATCTLDLPESYDTVPAGPLGAVLVTYSPSVKLTVTGGVAVDTSVTLNCEADYQWDQGVSTHTDGCTATRRPLKLSADSGLDTTLTGGIEVSAALDDLPGIKGSIDDSLHLGYHPEQSPVAELDASSDYELKATLANIWDGAPAMTIAHGEFFHVTLATWGSAPPTDLGAPAITVSPAEALPWNDSVCGFDDPTDGWTNTFTVTGTGFRPGEQVTIVTGWETYPGTVTASGNGAFSVTEFVGEVPSVLNEAFSVSADGSDGSVADSQLELESNGCVDPTDDAGTITMTWGGNGDDPDSEVDLYIDDVYQDAATTDDLGSGGDTTTFACPDSGSYTWSVQGTIDGGSVGTPDQTIDCTPAADGIAGHASAFLPHGAAAPAKPSTATGEAVGR